MSWKVTQTVVNRKIHLLVEDAVKTVKEIENRNIKSNFIWKDLSTKAIKLKRIFSERSVTLMRDIICSLSVLHTLGYFHRQKLGVSLNTAD